MRTKTPDINTEHLDIIRQYKYLLRDNQFSKNKADKILIRKAFDMAIEAHRNVRRKSGELYIFHPLAVARIIAGEIGLGTTSIVCSLLHDVVEDTEVTLDDIEGVFGSKVAKIIDGLTKVKEVFDQTESLQAENFRKILLTLADDVRVILIKLADRLHNMRTLSSMDDVKRRKIASETLFLYAPLAHRLGLYQVKSELEDLGLKYTEPEVYDDIVQKLKKTKTVRTRFINRFIRPIREDLNNQHIEFRIQTRSKSVYSIWNKMKKKNVPFEEIYDVFAVRIIIDSKPAEEKADCWRVYSIVTDHYTPNPDRLRDWISTPKANGYESLHTTVMSPTGKWVEVQIRTTRMNEIAEKGYAAHWKYKESAGETALDEWVTRIRDILDNPDPDALHFIDDFKLNLFSSEIFVFTPKGELRTLPKNATALDFAFDIHTQVGSRCIGAKVNQKLVPLSHTLKSGDQVEILTSSKQTPKEDWLKFVVTGKAKAKIKSSLNEEKRNEAMLGKEILFRKMKQHKIRNDKENINKLVSFYKLNSSLDLFYSVAKGNLDLKELATFKNNKGNIELPKPGIRKSLEQIVKKIRGKKDLLILGDNMKQIDYKLSPCCNPIPGDNVFGFITINDGIKIHRVNCPNAIQLMSNYGYRIVKARWTNQKLIAFLAGIKITGSDEVGIVNRITRIISDELHVNMRSVNFDTYDGTFEGIIMVYVHDTNHLTALIEKLRNIEGVNNVERIDNN